MKAGYTLFLRSTVNYSSQKTTHDAVLDSLANRN